MIKRSIEILFQAPAAGGDGVNLRRWFLGFVVYLVLLTVTAAACLWYYERGGSIWAMRGWLLALYLFYMSLCCTFFPAPTAWIILLMASPIVSMFEAGSFQGYFGVSETTGIWLAGMATTVVVATIGAAGTAIANLNEYHIFTFLLRYGRVHKVRQTRFFATAERWFSVSPFALVGLFSFLPIPVDVVRWLAISCRYSRLRYAGANFLGRFLRYGLLAGAATFLAIGWWGILGIQIGLAVLVIIRYLPRLVYRRKAGMDVEGTDIEDTAVGTEGVSS